MGETIRSEMEQRIFVDAYENARENTECIEHMDHVIEAVYQRVKCRPDYQNNRRKALKLERQIMKLLSSNSDKALFLEYERCVSSVDEIYLENVYLAGVQDGKH